MNTLTIHQKTQVEFTDIIHISNNQQYLNNFLDNLIAEYEQACIQNGNSKGFLYNQIQSILRSRSFLSKLLTPAIRSVEAVKKHNKLYFVSAANRMYAIEFLKYAISKPEVFNICNKFYHDQESLSALEKFFRNKLFCALYTSIPKKLIFSHADLLQISSNEKYYMHHVREFRTSYKVENNIFFKPFSFETSVFIEKLGLTHLSERAIRNISGLIIDCGAYTGDSAVVLAKAFPENLIWAIEFSKPNYDLLKKNIAFNNLENHIKCLNLAVGDTTKTLEICHSAGLNIREDTIGETTDKVRMVPLDYLCKDERVGLIKMDIEGSEMKALAAAKNTIIKNRPVLLLSVYHKGEDIYEIPNFINQLNLNYRFKLRHLKPESPAIDYMLICEPD